MSGWLDQDNGTMLYERKQNQQVLYVIPISSILGKLPLIPVGDTGTIPFSMRDKLREVDEASCESRPEIPCLGQSHLNKLTELDSQPGDAVYVD